MGREYSASSSRHLNPHSKHSCSSSESFAPSIIQRNLNELSASDLLLFAKELKHPGIIALRFYVASPADQGTVSRRFCDDQRATDNLSAFTRALANAVEWWMQSLELGMCLGASDITSLCPAIRYSETLRHLSFANSGLGDDMLHILSSALESCLPLRILNLSGCALTDASSSVIAAIVKGEDLPKCREVSASPAEHREPKYGRQWRQNVILRGKWPPPSRCDRACKSRNSPPPTHVSGLVALDISWNSFSDALTQQLCPVLWKKPALRALNLRCNLMTRLGAKPVLDVMKEVSGLHVVDLRSNKDGSSLAVLEDGEHYTTFSTFQAPFWMDAESLNPVCKPEKLVPENRMRFTALSRPKISTQHMSKIRNCAGSHNKTGSCTANNCSRAVGSAEWASNSQKRQARREKHTFCDQATNSFRQTSPEFASLEPSREHSDGFRRSQSAGGFHNYQDNLMLWNTADVAASSRRRDHAYSGRADPEITQYHHRCKLLNEVHEQHKRNHVARAKRFHTFTQMLPKAGPPLPDDNLKELLEWNNFVNQMTETLLNLKDGTGHLSGPSEGAIAEVAQQAATKLHQMPSFFLRSGMLRELDRSCRVLNSHMASLAKRRRESIRQLKAENEAPDLCDEAATTEEDTTDHDQDAAENHKLASRNASLQIERPKVPAPLSISKGTNFP